MEAVAKEVIAWRGWRVERSLDGQWFLHSINHAVEWTSPTLTADDTPSERNSNGIYALASRDWVAAQGYCGNCVGEVALSGVVVEGSSGYRAERATIRSLTLLGYVAPDVRPIEVMAALEERYQCEVAWEEAPQIANYDNQYRIQAAINASAWNNSGLSFAPANFPSYSTQFGSGILGQALGRALGNQI